MTKRRAQAQQPKPIEFPASVSTFNAAAASGKFDIPRGQIVAVGKPPVAAVFSETDGSKLFTAPSIFTMGFDTHTQLAVAAGDYPIGFGTSFPTFAPVVDAQVIQSFPTSWQDDDGNNTPAWDFEANATSPDAGGRWNIGSNGHPAGSLLLIQGDLQVPSSSFVFEFELRKVGIDPVAISPAQKVRSAAVPEGFAWWLGPFPLDINQQLEIVFRRTDAGAAVDTTIERFRAVQFAWIS